MFRCIVRLFYTLALSTLFISGSLSTPTFCYGVTSYTVPQTAEVKLAWDANDPAPEGYCIYQRKQGEAYDYSQPCWTGPNTTGTVYNLERDTTYHFVVRAYEGNQESLNSEEVSFHTSSPETTTFSITATASEHGTITPSGRVELAEGGNQSFAIVPNKDSHVTDVSVDGVSVGPMTTFTFSQISANHAISAEFAKNTHSILASAGTGGSISPSGKSNVDHGSKQAYTIMPESGYRVADVLVDGISVGIVSSYTFDQVVENHTIHAIFSISARSNDPSVDDAVVAGPTIIDDGQSGTSSSGEWKKSSGKNPYGTRSLYSMSIGSEYRFESGLSGIYDVELWWTQYSNRCSSVPVEIYDGATLLDRVYVNQQEGGGRWNFIGTYTFSGQARVVVVSESSSCSTGVDAATFAKVDDAVVAGPIVIDDGRTGTSSSGEWKVSSGKDPYGTQSLYSESIGGEYRYESELSGIYDVELWWTQYSNRCSSVPVEIYDGATLLDRVYVNQQAGGGRWNFIGTYTFSGQARVVVVSEGSCSTGADAVGFAEVDDAVFAGSTVIDDGRTGTSSSGEWKVSSGADPYGNQSLYSKSIGGEYRYESELSGIYDVELWWTQHSTRCSSVPVEIYDGATLLDRVYVNQQAGGGQWNFIGTYTFSGRAQVVIVSEGSSCTTGADAVEFSNY